MRTQAFCLGSADFMLQALISLITKKKTAQHVIIAGCIRNGNGKLLPAITAAFWHKHSIQPFVFTIFNRSNTLYTTLDAS
jgi:hypothetical protein